MFGPRILPCGTPALMALKLNLVLNILTQKLLLPRYSYGIDYVP